MEKRCSRTGDRRYTEINYKINSWIGDNKHAKASWKITLSISGDDEDKIGGS